MPAPINNDSFAESLASLDRNQLAELLNELGARGSMEYALEDPRTGEPVVMKGAGFKADHAAAKGSDKEKLRQYVGRTDAYGQYRHYRRNKKQKAAKAAYEDAMRAESERQKGLIAERKKMVEGQLRTMDLRDKVNQQFRDLDLEGLFDRVVKQGQDQAVLGITQQHDDLARQSGFGAVAQGLGGSSVDAERVADIQASQDAALAQSAASAMSQRQNLGANLDQQRRALLSSVSGANPGEEARLSGQLSDISRQAGMFADQARTSGYGMNLQQQGMAGQSQALGGLLSSYARLYNQDTSRRA